MCRSSNLVDKGCIRGTEVSATATCDGEDKENLYAKFHTSGQKTKTKEVDSSRKKRRNGTVRRCRRDTNIMSGTKVGLTKT